MLRTLVLIAAVAFTGAAAAQSKWVDKDGRVTYGDAPPQGANATSMGRAPSGYSPSGSSAESEAADKKDDAKRPLSAAEQDAEKREAEKKKQEEQKKVAEARERQAREAADLKAQAEREKAARDAQQQAIAANSAALSRAEADYIRRIQAKIKGNVVLPPDMNGNPEAIFEVVQLPTGEIIDAVLRKSSGVRAYDEAVQRAIQKSSPLPRPDRPELFQRSLTLKFRPLD